MARGFAIAHGRNTRPAGQPADGYREVRPQHHAVSRERNIQRINPTPTGDPNPSSLGNCVAPTRTGEPCKARPVTGGDHCVFHQPEAT